MVSVSKLKSPGTAVGRKSVPNMKPKFGKKNTNILANTKQLATLPKL